MDVALSSFITNCISAQLRSYQNIYILKFVMTEFLAHLSNS